MPLNPRECRAPVRIAIRHEGAWINAYMAEADTMDDALLVACLRASVADEMPGAFDAFRELCHFLGLGMIGMVLGPEAIAHARIEEEKGKG